LRQTFGKELARMAYAGNGRRTGGHATGPRLVAGALGNCSVAGGRYEALISPAMPLGAWKMQTYW
jgi:hypothetical protein